jgi:hypothetical protein
MKNDPLKLVITMEGGLIQWIYTGSAKIDVYVLDFDDAAQADPEEVFDIEFKEGVTEKAYINKWEVGEVSRDPAFIEQIERKYHE